MWQTIDTCPAEPWKTYLVTDGGEVGLGYFAPSDDDVPAGWFFQDAVGEYCGDPTHWMRLPDPPSVD